MPISRSKEGLILNDIQTQIEVCTEYRWPYVKLLDNGMMQPQREWPELMPDVVRFNKLLDGSTSKKF